MISIQKQPNCLWFTEGAVILNNRCIYTCTSRLLTNLFSSYKPTRNKSYIDACKNLWSSEDVRWSICLWKLGMEEGLKKIHKVAEKSPDRSGSCLGRDEGGLE